MLKRQNAYPEMLFDFPTSSFECVLFKERKEIRMQNVHSARGLEGFYDT
jgi:hypothetical protein